MAPPRAALVLVLGVVVLAVLARQYNYLALRIPHVGFIVYHVLGGPVPPYMDDAVFLPHNQAQWKSSKDVIVAVPGKSGTTWLMNTLHHIRHRGQLPRPFRDIYEECRWAEFVYYPGQSLQERIEVLKNSSLEHSDTFPIYKTHYGSAITGLRPDAKYIVQARNILDVTASLYPFFRSIDAGYAKMWGGFPVGAGQPERPGVDMQAYEHAMLVDMGNGQPMLDNLVLDLLAEFWQHRNEPNVLLLHYNDRLLHGEAEIARIAKFVGVPGGGDLTEQEVLLVHAKTAFDVMKQDARKFDLAFVHEPYRAQGKVPAYVKAVANGLVAVGPSRVGRTQLSPEFEQRIVAHVERRFGKQVAAWLEHGGQVVPDVDLPSK